jgi:hypothetical protein
MKHDENEDSDDERVADVPVIAPEQDIGLHLSKGHEAAITMKEEAAQEAGD